MKDKQKLVVVLFAGLIGGLLIGYGVGSKKPTTAPGHVSLSGSTDGACSAGIAVAPEGALFELNGKSYRAEDFSTLFKGRHFESKNESYHGTGRRGNVLHPCAGRWSPRGICWVFQVAGSVAGTMEASMDFLRTFIQ